MVIAIAIIAMTAAALSAFSWAGIGGGVGAALAVILTPRLLSPDRATRPRFLMAPGAAATALAFVLLAERFGGIELIAFTYIAAVGVVLSTTDLIEHRLPGRLVLPSYAVLAGLLTIVAIGGDRIDDLLRALCTGTLLAGTYLIVALTSRGGLGAGDVKFGGLLGIAMGWQDWSVMLSGTLLAWTLAATSLPLVRYIGKNRSPHLPMGPFLLTGALLAIVLQ